MDIPSPWIQGLPWKWKKLAPPESPSPWTASMALGLASRWGRDPNMWEEEMMVT